MSKVFARVGVFGAVCVHGAIGNPLGDSPCNGEGFKRQMLFLKMHRVSVIDYIGNLIDLHQKSYLN